MTHILNEPLSTARWEDERWTETSRTSPAHSLPPSLSCLSFCFPLSLLLPSPLSCNLTDVGEKKKNLCCSSSVCLHGPVDVVTTCTRVRDFGRRATCDHAYTWCIYTLFVSLSHQYAAEVRAGCCDPATAGQLADACLLVWMVTH